MIRLDGEASDKRAVYIFSGVFLAVLLSLLFVSKTVSRPVTAFFLVLAAVTAKLIIKKRAIPSIHKRTITTILTVSAVTLVALYYITGTHFGFFKNPYASTFGKSTYYVISLIASIISFEIIRNISLAQESRLATVLITLSGIAADVLISTKSVTMSSFNSFMDLVGLVIFPAVSANLFFNLIAKRYERLSTIITTNSPFSKWSDIFHEPVLTNALLDRLLHHCSVININGPSYRLKDQMQYMTEDN